MREQGADPVGDAISRRKTMIEAGVCAAREITIGAPLARLAWAVYLAMETERITSMEQAARNSGDTILN